MDIFENICELKWKASGGGTCVRGSAFCPSKSGLNPRVGCHQSLITERGAFYFSKVRRIKVTSIFFPVPNIEWIINCEPQMWKINPKRGRNLAHISNRKLKWWIKIAPLKMFNTQRWFIGGLSQAFQLLSERSCFSRDLRQVISKLKLLVQK